MEINLNQISAPLVSVIIPCYNHAAYLAECIESVLIQSYRNVEIIVVDDGSKDATKEVAQKFSEVRYLHQHNQGLSAARNTGIRNCKGEYLVFLDADDWLQPDALQVNLQYLQLQQLAAFVSGAHFKVNDQKEVIEEVCEALIIDPYLRLLEGNYIGMHATVMYRQWVFDEFKFDTSLNVCEDYDLYLKIARNHPVCHHTQHIALYRIHHQNMSGDIPAMLAAVLNRLKREEILLGNKEEILACKRGMRVWKNYYCKQLYKRILTMQSGANANELRTLFRYGKPLYFKYWCKRLINGIKRFN